MKHFRVLDKMMEKNAPRDHKEAFVDMNAYGQVNSLFSDFDVICEEDEHLEYNLDNRVELAEKMLEGIDISEAMIQKFLNEDRDSDNEGCYVSAMVNSTPDETLRFNVKRTIDELFSFVEGKKIEVYGNVGQRTGHSIKDTELYIYGNSVGELGMFMRSGKIGLYGDGGYCDAWNMVDGQIDIYGNVDDSAGWHMHGGLLYVHGKADQFLGSDMKGGRIVVNEATTFIGQAMQGGEIIIKEDLGNFAGGRSGGIIYTPWEMFGHRENFNTFRKEKKPIEEILKKYNVTL